MDIFYKILTGIIVTLILVGAGYAYFQKKPTVLKTNTEINTKESFTQEALSLFTDSKKLFKLSYASSYRIENEGDEFTICLPGNNYDEYNAYVERDNLNEKMVPLINCLWYFRLSNGNPTHNLKESAGRLFKGDIFYYVGDESIAYRKIQETEIVLGANPVIKRLSHADKGNRYQLNYLAMSVSMIPVEFTIEANAANLEEVSRQVEKILESLTFLN